MTLPVEINPLLLSQTSSYAIGRSLRFRQSASAYLNRTPASTTNQKTWTWSGWVKRGKLGSVQSIFSAVQGTATGNLETDLFFNSNDTLFFQVYTRSTVSTVQCTTTAVFRDPSAWYHVALVVDTTQATNSNGVKIYVNGVQQTLTFTAYTQNQNTAMNTNGYVNWIGHMDDGNNNTYSDLYLAEVNFIDGQALTPSSFGAYDTNGVWQPKKYTGTYGTNGFYLPFTSGFNTTQAYAGSFSGSGQFLNVAASASLAPSTGDFTIEANVNFNALPVSGVFTGIFENQIATTSATSDKFWFGLYNSSGQYQLRIGRHNAPNGSWSVWTPTVGTWYHVAVVRQSGVISIYINGVSQTMVQATDMAHSFSQNGASFGAASNTGSPAYFNGYISNARYVVGSAVYTTGFTPPSSNLTNITNTQWLTLQNATIIDNSSAVRTITNNGSVVTSNQYPFQYTLASISADYSGNNNNWTANNINATFLGTTYDSMIDSPTVSASSSNYCVGNPLLSSSSVTFSNANLTVSCGGGAGVYRTGGATFAVSSGKWYWEFLFDNTGGNPCGGVGDITQPKSTWESDTTISANFWYVLAVNGNKVNGNGGGTAYGSSFATTDICMVALDVDNGKLWFGKNGTWFASGDPAAGTNAAFTNLAGKTLTAAFMGGSGAGYTNQYSMNFGQRPFAYTPPTGYSALNTYNLPAATIKNGAQYMAATLYTGNGTAGRVITVPNINEVGFAWVKLRSGIDDHRLANIVTGGNKHLKSNTTDAESTGTNIIQAFSSNTFTVGNDTSVNANGSTYVGWTWAANGTGVTNTSGSITSTVSANTTAGFSVVTWTGNGSSSATVGHGLGVTPNLILAKSRSITNGWFVYHNSLSAGTYIQLNATSAANNISATSDGAISTSPTSTTFGFTAGTIGVNNVNQNTQTMVAYCFSAVSGYSAFGKYTGNGSTDGPFIYTGFRPRWLMIKRTDAAGGWLILDTSRDTYNVEVNLLRADTSAAETTAGSVNTDGLSNGFKIRSTNTDMNASGGTFIYAAFAENPFNSSRAR